MKIEVGRFYQTRDKRKVRIYAVDGGGDGDPIHGAILNDDGWNVNNWTISGEFIGDCTSVNDIVSEWEEPKEKKPRLYAYAARDANENGLHYTVFFSEDPDLRINSVPGRPTHKKLEWLDEPEEE